MLYSCAAGSRVVSHGRRHLRNDYAFRIVTKPFDQLLGVYKRQVEEKPPHALLLREHDESGAGFVSPNHDNRLRIGPPDLFERLLDLSGAWLITACGNRFKTIQAQGQPGACQAVLPVLVFLVENGYPGEPPQLHNIINDLSDLLVIGSPDVHHEFPEWFAKGCGAGKSAY